VSCEICLAREAGTPQVVHRSSFELPVAPDPAQVNDVGYGNSRVAAVQHFSFVVESQVGAEIAGVV
jgi:hypothetical protein